MTAPGYRKSHPKEHAAWRGMLRRCYDERRKDYKYYGGRGIKVCFEWSISFLRFLSDVGEAPSPLHSIDRIDNDGDYEPGNVRWVTHKEQCRNKRTSHFLEIDGVCKTLAEWAEEFSISRGTILTRIRQLGWDTKKAVLTPKDATRYGNKNAAGRKPKK